MMDNFNITITFNWHIVVGRTFVQVSTCTRRHDDATALCDDILLWNTIMRNAHAVCAMRSKEKRCYDLSYIIQILNVINRCICVECTFAYYMQTLCIGKHSYFFVLDYLGMYIKITELKLASMGAIKNILQTATMLL